MLYCSGQKMFLDENCPVNACNITSDQQHALTAELRLLQGDASFDDIHLQEKPPDQIWVLWLLESAENTQAFDNSENKINWTATYRWDSTIVTPYGKFVPYSKLLSGENASYPVFSSHAASKKKTSPKPRRHAKKKRRNFASGKTKMVAWFVSNCGARNRRLEYAKELGEYVSVDIYGACGSGNIHCERGNVNCTASLNRDYKFYLSFENSNCHYYITEKLFENGLSNDVVPIVMGSRREDYFHAAPPHSYIHVEDFRSAKDLALYLRYLDKNDDAYNEYFRWKTTGAFINTKFWCRLCALLHDDAKPLVWYSNFVDWWNTRGETCAVDRWTSPDSEKTSLLDI